MRPNLRLSYSTTVNRPEFRELAEFEFTDVIGNRAVKGNADLKRALIQNVDARWEMFRGGRGILAASVFFKYFDKPIERVVIARRTRLRPSRTADNARNFGIELEAGHQLGESPLLQRELHVRRLEDHAAAGAAGRADVIRAAAGGAVEEPVQPHR